MDATEGTGAAGAAGWEARALGGRLAPPGGGRWGVVHRPTGRWVAFGGEARCRQMAAHLNEVDAILRGDAPAATDSAAPDGRG